MSYVEKVPTEQEMKRKNETSKEIINTDNKTYVPYYTKSVVVASQVKWKEHHPANEKPYYTNEKTGAFIGYENPSLENQKHSKIRADKDIISSSELGGLWLFPGGKLFSYQLP